MRKENGTWHCGDNRIEKWFLKYFWGINFISDKPIKKYPQNTCSLFWGSAFGVIFTPVICVLLCAAIASSAFIIFWIGRLFIISCPIVAVFFIHNCFALAIIFGLMIAFIIFLSKTQAGKAFRDFVIAIKRRTCLPIIVDISKE